MPNRNYSAPSYRYGYNGQEKDDEVSGIGNSLSAEYWQYDPRLGRRWNIDPVVKQWESPFATFANNPILFCDPFGLDVTDPNGNVISAGESITQSPDGRKIYNNPDREKSEGYTTDWDYAEWNDETGAYDYKQFDPTTKQSVVRVASGTLGGLTLDFIVRDGIDFRNSYYNPKVAEAKQLWKAGQMSDEAYAMFRYHAQKATKMQYKSAISKAMGEIPPTGKPLWQQKQLAESIASGKTKISANAGQTRGLTTKIASQTSTKIIGRTLLVVSAGMSVYTIVTAEDKAKAATTEASGWAGAWGGATLGATWGAAIGGPFAPITGAVGGLIGGGIGYYLGSETGGTIYDAIKEE